MTKETVLLNHRRSHEFTFPVVKLDTALQSMNLILILSIIFMRIMNLTRSRETS